MKPQLSASRSKIRRWPLKGYSAFTPAGSRWPTSHTFHGPRPDRPRLVRPADDPWYATLIDPRPVRESHGKRLDFSCGIFPRSDHNPLCLRLLFGSSTGGQLAGV
jgi:hypothetical protein